MKNQKKKKRVEINCGYDLIDALLHIAESANEKLADAGSESTVNVDSLEDTVSVKLDGKTVYSVSVTDENASSAFGPLKGAIERAKKLAMPKVDPPKTIVDDLDNTDMAEERFRSELEKLAEMANERLVLCLGADKISEVVINFTFDGDDTVIRSGDTELVTLHGHAFGAVKKAKSVVWPKVDELKNASKPSRGGCFADRLEEIVKSANNTLAELGADSLSVKKDSVGYYVSAGSIPVFSLPSGVGSAEDAIRKANEKVHKFVDEVRGAVERRRQNAQRAKEIEDCSSWDVAILAKANPDMDQSEPWKLGPNADVAAAIVEAAKKSVNAFNASIRFKFDGIEEILGEGEKRRMCLKGFTRGLVVSFGDDPCFITTFPLVCNVANAGDTVAYVSATIASIGESRKKFYAAILEEEARRKRLMELAARKDALDSEIAAMAM